MELLKGIGSLNKKIALLLLVSLSAVGLLLWVVYGARISDRSTRGSSETLTLGTSAIDLSALIWIAKSKGYFSEQNLNLDIRLYESGHLAIRDLLAGKLDLATATEFAAVQQGFQRLDFRIVSILDQASQDQQLVARRDRGVKQLSDLRNKRIGVVLGTSAEHYLHLLLILEKMHPRDVHIVNLLPSEQVEALSRGEIDAAMAWEPFATLAKEKLGENAIGWPGQSGQDEYWLLLSTVGAIEKKSRAIKQFLSSLARAEDFIASNGIEAKKIMTKQLGDRHSDALWRNHRFRLGLHRPLLLKMETELRWLGSSHPNQQLDPRQASDFVDFDLLHTIQPKKIKILYRNRQ